MQPCAMPTISQLQAAPKLSQISLPARINFKLPAWTDDVHASAIFNVPSSVQGTWLEWFTEGILKGTRFTHGDTQCNAWKNPQPGEQLPPGAVMADCSPSSPDYAASSNVGGQSLTPCGPGTALFCQKFPTAIMRRDIVTFLTSKWGGPIQCLSQIGREPADDLLPTLFEVWWCGWDVSRRGANVLQPCGNWFVQINVQGQTQPTAGVYCWNPNTLRCEARPLTLSFALQPATTPRTAPVNFNIPFKGR